MVTPIRALVKRLEKQKDKINSAIEVLASLDGMLDGKTGKKAHHTMSASARKRISMAQKKRWREQRKNA